jgi:hypothetical protein
MPSSDATGRQSAERARALLAALDIQPPPDFEVQVLARVYALQAGSVSHPAPYAHPLPSQRFSQGWRKAGWHARPRPRISGLRIMACGLVVASAVLVWGVSMRLLPAALPEEGRQACTILKSDTVPIEDGLDGSGRRTVALHEEVAAEPVLQPDTLALQPRKEHRSKAERAREEEPAVRPEAPVVPGLPLWSREVPKLSVKTQEQRSGRQRGLRGKAKRSGPGLRPSRHLPA